MYLNKNIPGVKKEQPRTKKGLVEKDVKSKWVAKALWFRYDNVLRPGHLYQKF